MNGFGGCLSVVDLFPLLPGNCWGPIRRDLVWSWQNYTAASAPKGRWILGPTLKQTMWTWGSSCLRPWIGRSLIGGVIPIWRQCSSTFAERKDYILGSKGTYFPRQFNWFQNYSCGSQQPSSNQSVQAILITMIVHSFANIPTSHFKTNDEIVDEVLVPLAPTMNQVALFSCWSLQLVLPQFNLLQARLGSVDIPTAGLKDSCLGIV